MILKCIVHTSHLGILLAGSDLKGLGWGLRVCLHTSVVLPVADAVVCGPSKQKAFIRAQEVGMGTEKILALQPHSRFMWLSIPSSHSQAFAGGAWYQCLIKLPRWLKLQARLNGLVSKPVSARVYLPLIHHSHPCTLSSLALNVRADSISSMFGMALGELKNELKNRSNNRIETVTILSPSSLLFLILLSHGVKAETKHLLLFTALG